LGDFKSDRLQLEPNASPIHPSTSAHPDRDAMDPYALPGSTLPPTFVPSPSYPASTDYLSFEWMRDHSTSGTRSSLLDIAPEIVERPVYACEEDDRSFIEYADDCEWEKYNDDPLSQRHAKMMRKHLNKGPLTRIALLHQINIDHWDNQLDEQDQWDVLRSWLEGMAENDIWLWVDGDEKEFRNAIIDSISWRSSFLQRSFPALIAVSALDERKAHSDRQETPQQAAIRRRVHAAHPSIRIGMIIWLAMTSVQLKKLGAYHGMRDREQVDLRSLVESWDGWHRKLVGANTYSWESDEETIYFNTFTSRRHSCHQSYVNESYLAWFAMVRQLDPGYYPSGFDVRPDSPCLACRQYYQIHFLQLETNDESPSPLPVWMLMLSSMTWDGRISDPLLNGIHAIHEAVQSVLPTWDTFDSPFSELQLSYVEKELSNVLTNDGALDHRIARWAQSPPLRSLLAVARPFSSGVLTSHSLNMPPMHEVEEIGDYAHRDYLAKLPRFTKDNVLIGVKEWFAAVVLLVCRFRSKEWHGWDSIADFFFYALKDIQSRAGQCLLFGDSQFDDEWDWLFEDVAEYFVKGGHSCWFDLPPLHRKMYILANKTLNRCWDTEEIDAEWTGARSCWRFCDGRVRECKRCLLSSTLSRLAKDVSFHQQPLAKLQVRCPYFSFLILIRASVSCLDRA
jgi:hypothetical protein